MAQIDEARYNNMISALYRFNSTVYVASSEMQTLAMACINATDNDQSAINSYERLKPCLLSYSSACNKAKEIAGKMQEELEEAKRAAAVASEDD